MVSYDQSANPKTTNPGIDPALGRISVRHGSGRWIPVGQSGASLPESGALRLEALSSLVLRGEPLPRELVERLVALDLRGLPVTADLLRGLGPLPALETLVLAETAADDDAISAVASYSGLHALDISGTCVTDAGLAALQALPLRSLIVNRTAVTNEAAATLAAMKGLQVLRLGDTRMDDEGVRLLGALVALCDVELPARTTDEGVAALRNLPALATLWLGRASITDQAFDEFPASSPLRMLALPEQYGDAGLRSLTRFSKLESLWLEGCEISAEGMDALACLTKLSDYYFTAPIADSAAQALARLHAPRRLCLFSPLTTRYSVEVLSASPSLEELRLASSTFRDQDGWLLGRFARLRSVHFIESGLSARGFRELQESLPACRVTHAPRSFPLPRRVYQGELLMRRNSPDGSTPWVAVDPSLDVLRLPADSELSYRASCCEDLPELQGFGEGIVGQIVELKLTQCVLGAGLVPLLEKMPRLACLEAPKGVIAGRTLASVAGHPGLQKLVLDLTSVGDAEMAVVAGSRSLGELHLRATPVTDAGLHSLAGLSSLKELRVNGARVTEKGVEAFRTARPDVRLVV